MATSWKDTLKARREGLDPAFNPVTTSDHPAWSPDEPIDWTAIATSAGTTKSAINTLAQAIATATGEPKPTKVENASESVQRAVATLLAQG